jgi:Domain of unknown function (DUF1857)
MKFSHLVQINDPMMPLIDPLSREQVWRGLMLRAENPLLFVYALDDFRVLGRSSDSITRELRFGRVVIRDRVTFFPRDGMRYDIEAAGEVPAATLRVSIEEPGGGQLFVRFDYETRHLDGAPPVDEFYQGFVKQAYVEADKDSIRTIRRLAAEGRLESDPA